MLHDPWTGEEWIHTTTDVFALFHEKICFLGTLEDEDGIFWATRAGTTKSLSFYNAEYALRWLEDKQICPFCPPDQVENIGHDFFGTPVAINDIRCCEYCYIVHHITDEEFDPYPEVAGEVTEAVEPCTGCENGCDQWSLTYANKDIIPFGASDKAFTEEF